MDGDHPYHLNKLPYLEDRFLRSVCTRDEFVYMPHKLYKFCRNENSMHVVVYLRTAYMTESVKTVLKAFLIVLKW